MASEYIKSDSTGLIVAASYLAEFLNVENRLTDRLKAAKQHEDAVKQFGLSPNSREALRWQISQGEAASKRTAQLRREAKLAEATAKPTAGADDPNQKVIDLYAKYS